MNDHEFEAWNLRQRLLLRAVANRFYQQQRQQHFERLEHCVKALSLILGSVAVVQVTNVTVVVWCSAILAGLNALSLILSWGSRSLDAMKRAAEWTNLEVFIQSAGLYNVEPGNLAKWSARAAEIEIGESAQSKVLWARSYTKACEVLELTPVKNFSRWLRHRPILFLS